MRKLPIFSIFLLFFRHNFGEKCGNELKPRKLAVVGIWSRQFDNSTSQYRISDEDLSVRGYERTTNDVASSSVMLARHPDHCVLSECGIRLSAMLQRNGAILHTDHSMLRSASELENIEDEFYCARGNNSCGADIPIYRLVKHSLNGPHYAYAFGTFNSLPGYEKEYFPICYAWRNTPSIVTFNTTDPTICFTLPAVPNGKIVYSSPPSPIYTIGTTATLHCERDFAGGADDVTLVCTNAGWYPREKLGFCVPQRQRNSVAGCEIPRGVSNGNVVYSANVAAISNSSGVPHATRATVLCNLGYVPTSGSSSSKCVGGAWEPALPKCVSIFELRCPILGAPRNGELVFGDDAYAKNSLVHLKCHSHFAVVGNASATCQEDGKWSQQIGKCEAVSSGSACSEIASPSNGTVLYIQSNPLSLYSSGTTAYLMCNIGMTLQNSISSMCINGEWSPTLGTCSSSISPNLTTSTNCADIATPSNGVVSYSSGTTTHPSLSTASLTCTSTTNISGAASSTCTNGVWSPSSLGSCTTTSALGTVQGSVSGCTSLTVLNGQVTYNTGNSLQLLQNTGTTATLTCNSGYTSSGSTQAICTSGSWSPTLGACQLASTTSSGVTCSNPTILNGQVTYNQGSVLELTKTTGTTATVSCNSGYTLSGTSQAICTAGTWIPTLGTCTSSISASSSTIGTGCASPTVLGGTITYNPTSSLELTHSTGTTATLTCTTGYTLTGSSTASCFSGTWSPSLGSCQLSGLSTGSTSGVQCGVMLAPFGGTVSYSSGGTTAPFASGTVATATCSNGGSVQGTSSASCENGLWNPTFFGTCSLISSSPATSCSALGVPNGAQATYTPFSSSTTNFSSGTLATVTCTSSGQQLGSSTCASGVWTPAIGGTCDTLLSTSSTCKPLTLTFGESVTYGGYGDTQTSYTSGTVAKVQCSNGTSIGETTCVGGEWSPAITQGACSASSTSVGSQCISVLAAAISRVRYSDGDNVLHNTGVTATISCTSGELQGSSSSTCQNGVWTPTLGSCSSATGTSSGQCYAPPVTPNGANLTYSNGMLAPWSSGDTITLNCPTGQFVIGTSTTTCQNSEWTPTIGSCSGGLAAAPLGISCGVGIGAVLNANMVYSNEAQVGPYPSGTIVTATCNTGFIPSGVMSSSCQSGVWNPSVLGICELTQLGLSTISCGRLADSLFGSISYSAGGEGPYPTGSTATMICNLGYIVSGTATSICTEGVWSPPLGVCTTSVLRRPTIGGACTPPIAPSFGEITFSTTSTNHTFADGTTAALRCNLGYRSTGASFATCHRGSFRPILGSCESGAPSTTPGICVPLSPPKHARVVYIQNGSSLDFQNGTTALLYCEEGFAVTGTATLQCRGGQWEPSAGFGQCDAI